MTTAEAIQRLRAVVRRQHKALSTEASYVHWLRRYMAAIAQMPNALESERKLERFLTDLALQNVSASTQNQAFNAVLFFYREVLNRPLAKVDGLRSSRPCAVRHAPSIEDIQLLISAVRDVGGYPTNLITRLIYGCGLRVTEPLNLRVKDVNCSEGQLIVRGAKGGKDRVVSIPCSLAPELQEQIQFARRVWQWDLKARIPLALPNLIANKYPEYQFAWGWAWLFPARHPCRHPRSGETVRFRMHEVNVQRAVKEARRRLGIMVLPHELRHAYATHSLNGGVNIKALQAAMGHVSVETTIGYCHADAMGVPSPLDTYAEI